MCDNSIQEISDHLNFKSPLCYFSFRVFFSSGLFGSLSNASGKGILASLLYSDIQWRCFILHSACSKMSSSPLLKKKMAGSRGCSDNSAGEWLWFLPACLVIIPLTRYVFSTAVNTLSFILSKYQQGLPIHFPRVLRQQHPSGLQRLSVRHHLDTLIHNQTLTNGPLNKNVMHTGLRAPSIRCQKRGKTGLFSSNQGSKRVPGKSQLFGPRSDAKN